MNTFIDHMKRDKHAAALCIISGTGVLYFFLSLCWWTFFLWQFRRLFWGLSVAQFIEHAVLPVAECLVLFASFVFAFAFCRRRKRGMEFIVFGCVWIANAAFLFDTQFSRAQIHVFGPPGINHFYVTWWLYSYGPHLAPPIRYAIALIIVSIVASAILFSKWKFRNDAQLGDGR